ncbi:pectin acetylesterase-family hydrolase [Aureibacter tunicatorum]|uniref:Pectinacetylesterase n=1 Tax=Aureibacter tunicatorum TaxID=866807 RepID=A0AAE3XU94_9BACT|nr:pectin acetylesterase-family hydrolase [Aureibacter tunicatorum]MDR6241996.1 hypothetical protein [Aureibacter tunicatorum]BDD07271.1 hypothetical protein AUTU_47540 [Aureibacter tunicatorum]
MPDRNKLKIWKASKLIIVAVIIVLVSTIIIEWKDYSSQSTNYRLNKWMWVPTKNYICRDGSTSGFITKNGTGNSLVIFLSPGGSCFNSVTCIASKNKFNVKSYNKFKKAIIEKKDIFSDSPQDNPFYDADFLILPYCTGDLHSGTNSWGRFKNQLKRQQFVGRNNIECSINIFKKMNGLKKYDKVILWGESAGGFGSLINFDYIASQFPDSKFTMFINSGPMLLGNNIYTNCMRRCLINLYKIKIPDDYHKYINDINKYAFKEQGFYEYVANKYPENKFIILSSEYDWVMRNFYGFGQSNCNPWVTTIDSMNYNAALRNLKHNLNDYHNWHVEIGNGSNHIYKMDEIMSFDSLAMLLTEP